MIRKTIKVYDRRVTSSTGRVTRDTGILTHREVVTKVTWWFLFLPVLSYERVKYQDFN